MLKSMLLATAVAFSVPAMAQDVPQTPAEAEPATPPESTPIVSESEPQTAPAAPEAAAPVQESAPATVAEQAEPVTPVTPAEAPAAVAETETPTPAPAPAEVASTPEAKTATTQTEIASVVTSEFANYDKDANGELDNAEFATWMSALRKASDPSFDPAAPASATWTSQAFAQADTDKNMTVNAAELTGFLTPKG